jgi:hypothetical protein
MVDHHQDLEEDPAAAQQQQNPNPEMIQLNDEPEELDVDEQPFQLDEVEDVPEIGAELEIEQESIPFNTETVLKNNTMPNIKNFDTHSTYHWLN